MMFGVSVSCYLLCLLARLIHVINRYDDDDDDDNYGYEDGHGDLPI